NVQENNEAKDGVEDINTDNKQEIPEVLEDEEFENEDIIEDKHRIITELTKDNLELAEENKKINNELETLKDRLVRNVAEYDNFRKRTAKEKEGIYTDACEDILKLFLPVLDNLERAVSVEGNIEDLKKGVDMTLKQFNSALEKLNVIEIPSEGEFDPNLHNAVMHIDDQNLGKNQIVEVFQKGYKRGDKVLRFSMVKVAN
ncbi:MAG: heat shock protein GrpE, partial [Clostridiaceae bacterium]|nr:heat shock protein GrpE [Clostridiaceae bacterium]